MLEAFEGAWHPDPEDVVINIVPEDSWLPWLVPPLSSMAAYLQPELSPPLLRSFLNLQQPSLRLPRCDCEGMIDHVSLFLLRFACLNLPLVSGQS